MDVSGHDADFAFSGLDDAGAVRAYLVRGGAKSEEENLIFSVRNKNYKTVKQLQTDKTRFVLQKQSMLHSNHVLKQIKHLSENSRKSMKRKEY